MESQPEEWAEFAGSFFAVVYNIPKRLHSKDLRVFFSHFVEQGLFECFFYRHRPESKALPSWNLSGRTADDERHLCCVVRFAGDNRERFIERYDDSQWYNAAGLLCGQKCRVVRVDNDRATLCEQRRRPTRPGGSGGFTSSPSPSDTAALVMELRPPAFMPRGNVGTPTATLLQTISSCRFPCSMIARLGLSRSMVSSVGTRPKCQIGYDYATLNVRPSRKLMITSRAAAHAFTPLLRNGDDEKNVDGWGPYDDEETEEGKEESVAEQQQRKSQKNDEGWRPEPYDRGGQRHVSDRHCEDWERHEALHDDVDSQARIKERLYEQEMEVVWEKGGSGLVFYTDATYWHQQQPDTDEQWADDWDVDMAVYRGEHGDMDARQMLSIRRSDMLKAGQHQESVFRKKTSQTRRDDVNEPLIRSDQESASVSSGVGSFEAHTRGVGRKILERFGWTEGTGLGSSRSGQTYPVALDMLVDSQSPRCRMGLGYTGEKLCRKPRQPPRQERHLISTVYDQQEPYAGETLLSRAELEHNKHR